MIAAGAAALVTTVTAVAWTSPATPAPDITAQPGAAAARTITVDPNPIAVGERYTIRGTGWPSGRGVRVYVCEDADNDNCTLIARRGIKNGRFAVRAPAEDGTFSAVRIMACYPPTCTGKMIRRVQVVGDEG